MNTMKVNTAVAWLTLYLGNTKLVKNSRCLVIALALMGFPPLLFAETPTFDWLRTVQNLQDAHTSTAHKVAVDSEGNVIVIGHFHGTMNFNPGQNPPVLLTSTNSFYNIFITKYRQNGDHVWTKAIGGDYSTLSFSSFLGVDPYSHLVIDQDNNIIIAGYFVGSSDFDPSEDTDIHESKGGRDIFITKLSNDGSYQYTVTMGGERDDIPLDLALDATGSLVLTGFFTSPAVDFDPTYEGTDTHLLQSSVGGFITKLGNNGSYEWTHTFDGFPNGLMAGKSVAINRSREIYAMGIFQGQVDFDPTENEDIRTSNGERDIYLTKFSPNGAYISTLIFGGSLRERPTAVRIDSQDNLYLTGSFNDRVDFDPTAGEDFHEAVNICAPNVCGDIFITKVTADHSYQWTKTIGAPVLNRPYYMHLDSEGNVYLTGSFGGTIDFDPTNGTDFHTAIASTDIYAVKIYTDGSYGWAVNMGYDSGPFGSAPTNHHLGSGLATDRDQNAILVGFFRYQVDFDPGPGIVWGLTRTYFESAFILQLRPRYSLNINVVGRGAVVRQPDLSTYGRGEAVLLRAVRENARWDFERWSGDLMGARNPVIIGFNRDTQITAWFTARGPEPLAIDFVPNDDKNQ